MVKTINIKDVTSEYLYDCTTKEYVETEQVREQWDELKGHFFRTARKTKYRIDVETADFILDEFVRYLQENDYLNDDIYFTEEQYIRLATVVDEIIQEAHGDIEYVYHTNSSDKIEREVQE